MSRLLLAADVGGTKCRLALFEEEAGALSAVAEDRYPSADFPSLEAVAARFLEGRPIPEAAAFGVPGAVHNGRARTTNLPWVVEAQAIASRFGIARVRLLNDLAANALGITHLAAEDLAELQAGEPGARGNRCVISPGTGLG
ncbi:MAG: glucokinase, partial [Terrimicrobiaceae bacterium]|nr:glucokinase [Terrimicrobiaceae bacterium]